MIQFEELKAKLLELKPQIDDYRSAIGLDDLVKNRPSWKRKQRTPLFGTIWRIPPKRCSRSAS